MIHKKFKLIALLFIGLGLTGLKAQTAIPAAGDNASGSGGSLSYSVGQIVYSTNTGTNGSAVQGVQIPFEIIELHALEEFNDINLVAMVYPNPTKDFVKLTVDVNNPINIRSLSYQIYDINGQLLITNKLESNETEIALSNLLPATYFLKVNQSNKAVKSFKIIKNK